MQMILNNLKKKIKNSAGMSLGETLFAVLILLLVSSLMAKTISLANDYFMRSIRNSDAKVLCSSLRTIMETELAYTEEIKKTSGGEYLINCQDYGNGIFRSDASGKNNYGKIVFAAFGDSDPSASFDNPDETREILGSASYSNGLTANILSMTYSETNYCFTVKLSIGYKGKELYQEEFQVQNANQRKLT